MLVCWCVMVLVCWCMVVLCDASVRRVSTQPKLTVLSHAYWVLVCWCVGVLVCWCVGVLVCWCVGVLVCWCVGVWLLYDASMRGVSTQPKLTDLSHAYWVLVFWCMVVV